MSYESSISYLAIKEYEGVNNREVSVWDLLPANMKIRRDMPGYAMSGGNIKGQTMRNTGSIELSSTFGDEEDLETTLLHEITHNTHPRGHEEMATRYATASTLHQWGKDLGSHKNYFVGMQSQYYH